MKALAVFIGFAISNFGFAIFADQSLVVAVEHTFFEGNALFVYWLCDKFVWPTVK